MVVSKPEGGNIKADIQIDNETLEKVKTFKYLGRTITPDGKIEIEIKIKKAIAKNSKCTTYSHQEKYLWN